MPEQKNILIAGASGMIGSALQKHLTESGYSVYALSRHNSKKPFYFNQANSSMTFDPSIPLYGVINLSGANISDKRWNEKRKQEIISSRELTTALLSDTIATLKNKPAVFLSGSAIGFYGPTGDSHADETHPAGSDFLAEVAQRWENATLAACSAGIRTVHMRFGIVLSVTGGVLKNFLLPFRTAVVGPIGKGQQQISWISIHDVLELIDKALINENLSGPVNFVSNAAVSSDEFSLALSRAAERLRLPTIPAFIARLMFGEMADAALLASSDVRSKRYDEISFELQHGDLEPALKHLLDTNT